MAITLEALRSSFRPQDLILILAAAFCSGKGLALQLLQSDAFVHPSLCCGIVLHYLESMIAEIVIGIDFGTTYTGVSWARATATSAAGITLVDTWPDPKASNSNRNKTPSLISYKHGNLHEWGFTAKKPDDPLRWAKILLQPQKTQTGIQTEQIVEHTRETLAKIGKGAEEAVTDYLRFMWDYVIKKDLERQFPNIETMFRLRLVVTVPAMWEPIARESTRRALRGAGVNVKWPIDIVTEPEAAALASYNDIKESKLLKVGDCFVVCDAGGGTVDLVSYEIVEENPLALEEIVKPKGEVCGSVLLDRSFEGQIRIRVGEEVYDGLKAKHKDMMMWDFEDGIKRSFDDKDQEYYVDLYGVPDGDGIDGGTITVTRDSLRAIFIPVCSKVQQLLADQITVASSHKKVIKAVLLVGGFGMSSYLRSYLEKHNKADGISVFQPRNGISAICRGATMWGLERSKIESGITKAPTVRSTISKYSYGTPVHLPWDEKKYHAGDKWQDPVDGMWRAANQMDWVIKSGDKISFDKELKILLYQYKSVDRRHFTLPEVEMSLFLYYSEGIPSRKDSSVKQLCKLTGTVPGRKLRQGVQVKSQENGQKMFKINFEVVAMCGMNLMEFKFKFSDKEYGSVKTEYLENTNLVVQTECLEIKI